MLWCSSKPAQGSTVTVTVMGYDTNGCFSSTQTIVIFYFDLKINSCTGIAEYFELTTTIAPNPAKENTELSFVNNAPKNITIINAFGETVFSKSSGETTVKIDVSDFPQGVYFVTIISHNQKAIKKLIVQ